MKPSELKNKQNSPTFLRLVFGQFFFVLPTHSGFVNAIILDAILASESGLVVLLRLVLLSLLNVFPTNSRLILAIFLNSKFPSKTGRVIWKISVKNVKL